MTSRKDTGDASGPRAQASPRAPAGLGHSVSPAIASEHTPEPWRARAERGEQRITTMEGGTVALTAVEANASRIVACVNACGPDGEIAQILAALREARDTGLSSMGRDEMISMLAKLRGEG